MNILAIDPGPTESAWVKLESGRLAGFGKEPNERMLSLCCAQWDTVLVIEKIESYGMAVGAEVFETVFWSGRFAEAWHGCEGQFDRIGRGPVKMHLCGSMRAKDGNIRAALIDRYGPGKEKAIGRKKTPGPLFGVSGDCWSALAVAVTWTDLYASKKDVC